MQIRMLADFTYPLDETGSVERTLPRGFVFNEAAEIAEAAIEAGKAESLDTVEGEAEADAPEADAPEADAPEAPRRRGR